MEASISIQCDPFIGEEAAVRLFGRTQERVVDIMVYRFFCRACFPP
jgi:hypothetical protein